jgi:cytochrome c oxidase subunit 2
MSAAEIVPRHCRSRRVHLSVSGIAVLALAALCCVRRVGADSAVRTITIHAVRYEFDPAEITLRKGQPVQLIFTADDVGHGISIPGLGVEADLPKHKSESLMIKPAAAGDFEGECSRYCGTRHSDMTFLVHVKP